MTKAPFSVEWLSQSSQALKSTTAGSTQRSSSEGHRPAAASSPGLSERSKKQPAGPRAGRGGRSRERLAAPSATGNGGLGSILVLLEWEEKDGRAWYPPQSGSPDKARLCSCCPEAKEASGHPRGSQALADPFLSLSPVPRSRRAAAWSRAVPAGGKSRALGLRGGRRQGRPAATHCLQRRAGQHPGELLPEATIPGGCRAPQAGRQDAALGGSG